MSITITRAVASDCALIAEFNVRMALETEHLQLSMEVVSNGVKRLLQDPSKGHYYVAQIGGECVGSAMITYEWSDWRDGQMWWIQSVYVSPEQRRKGVFRALHQHVASEAKQHPDSRGLRLYVERENLNAQATYDAMGMHETHYRLYEQGF